MQSLSADLNPLPELMGVSRDKLKELIPSLASESVSDSMTLVDMNAELLEKMKQCKERLRKSIEQKPYHKEQLRVAGAGLEPPLPPITLIDYID